MIATHCSNGNAKPWRAALARSKHVCADGRHVCRKLPASGCDQLRYMYIEEMGWKYVVRFRQDIHITHGGKTQSAKAWLRDKGGRTTKLTGVKVTNDKTEIPCVVLTHSKDSKGMKEAWCLASNRSDLAASQIVKIYGRRFTIEETFRDTKDIHFGMALSATHIKSTARRDRILLLAAMAYALLVLLGAAGERAELDRTLKTNTAKKRTLSLYNQGKYWYSALPNMRDDRRDPQLEAYEQVLLERLSISSPERCSVSCENEGGAVPNRLAKNKVSSIG